MRKGAVIIALTAKGAKLGEQIQKTATTPKPELWQTEDFLSPARQGGAQKIESMRAGLVRAFKAKRAIIAICKPGIVIRLLAPLLNDKKNEPPVLWLSEEGTELLTLLGAHREGDALARELRQILNIGSDSPSPSPIDAPPEGWVLASDPMPVLRALAENQKVKLCTPFAQAWPFGYARTPQPATQIAAEPMIIVSAFRETRPRLRDVWLIPPLLTIGVGCSRNAPKEQILQLVREALNATQYRFESVAGIASLEEKCDEESLFALEETLQREIRFFSAESLEKLTPLLANPSEEVFETVGCHGVAEAAALALAGAGARLLVPKMKSAMGTCAIALAAAPLNIESLAGRRRGYLQIIGSGPGGEESISPEATQILCKAEHWVGYRGYLDALKTSGAQKHGFEIGEERKRCAHAIALAAKGARVALVCSGDPGIYALAGLAIELCAQHPEPAARAIRLSVHPGISSLQAAAAKAGAPIGHDFCAISLSDLLTPSALICKRITAAAKGDFVTLFFNPQSQKRQTLLHKALEIMRRYRSLQTPVIHARNIGRESETLIFSTLGEFDTAQRQKVDMFSLLIVGNGASRLIAKMDRRYVVTPRGYLLD